MRFRTLMTLTTAAPLAFVLAACSSQEPAGVATTDAMGTTAAVDTNGTTGMAATPAPMPSVATNARTSVKYAGTYEQTGPDGRKSSLTLNDDDTYSMTGPDGVQKQGTYSWYKDGSRILIKDGDTNNVYGVADGAVYKMNDENAPATDISPERMYSRTAAGQPQM